jgi:hypothetical protein
MFLVEALEEVRKVESKLCMEETLDEEEETKYKEEKKDNVINDGVSIGLNQLGLDLMLKIPDLFESSPSKKPSLASSFLLSLTPPTDFSLSTTSSVHAPILIYDVIRYRPQTSNLKIKI